MKEVAQLTAQFDSSRTTKDGGGKITFEYGMDGLEAIQKIQYWAARGEVNFIVVCSPITEVRDNAPNNEDY